MLVSIEGSRRRGNAEFGRMLEKDLATILSKQGDQKGFPRFKTMRPTSLGSQVLLWPRTLQLVWLDLRNIIESRHTGLIRKLLCLGKKHRSQRHESENMQAFVKGMCLSLWFYVRRDLMSNLQVWLRKHVFRGPFLPLEQ